MTEARIAEIVRRFPENGMKVLLENPRNVRDLLRLTGAGVVDLIDFDALSLVRTTFVARDYRHIEADVVLRAPLRRQAGLRPWRGILIYILIEHQSEPDRLMPFRLLEYLVQVYKVQQRDWARRHRSYARFRFQPVLPVVFYTGSQRWETVGRFVDLIELGERFAAVTPAYEPLFLNLPALPAEQLESTGGFFGWILRLIQERHRRVDEFRALLQRVVQHLETMPAPERLRWLEFLSYIQAFVYHERSPMEHSGLQDMIEALVQTDEHRQEVTMARRSMADVLKEEGRKEGRKEGEALTLKRTLVRLLRCRFEDVSPGIVATIKATDDVKRLNAWIDRVVTATTLGEIGIGPGMR